MAAGGGGGGQLRTSWVKDVTHYSSQYGSDGWAAKNIVGPCRVYPSYGDNSLTWTHTSAGSQSECVQVIFDEKMYIREVEIYETYHGGAVVRIELKSPTGEWKKVYSADKPTHVTHSQVFSPAIQETRFKCSEMKLIFDCSACQNWYEVDAIQIKGHTFLGAPAPPLKELSHDLGQMVNKSDFSDVIFVVEGKNIFGHRVVLAARCPYFRTLFKAGHRGKEQVTIRDVCYNTFLALLQFLYTNDIDPSVTPEVMTDLLRFAKRESLQSLTDFCMQTLHVSLTSENVVRMYRDANEKEPQLDVVVEMCVEHLSSCLDVACHSEEFKSLPQQVMLQLIQRTANLSK